MMHAKTDSEVTSLAPSSPDHNRRPAYYVQSPSRDSHDGEKTTSFHSTPVISPMGSPPHSHSHSNSSIGRHSRESSTSRFSGSLKPGGSTKILPNDDGSGGGKKGGRKIPKDWEVIEEEGLLDERDSSRQIPRRCYVLAFILGFFILFSLFSLILLAAAKPQKPKITMKSIKFETLGVQAGSDATGVSTDMVTTNSTVKFIFRNTATFFGVHVTSTPLDLSYSQLTIGSGSMEKFYQKRKSQRTVTVSVLGDKIPLYGSGSSLSTPKGVTSNPVNVTLSFKLRSRGYVLGRLVKPKFYKQIDCIISFDLMKLNASIPLKNACTYD